MDETKRSTYSSNQQLEEISRTHIRYFFNRASWKFRDIDQDNDIDAEIEVFEPVGEKRETSAKFIKAQLKSTQKSDQKDGIISYQCPVKFLHFADVCDIPVVLFLYDDSEKAAYWTWVQREIYMVLDQENPNWRNNKTSVTLKLKVEQKVTDNEKFFQDLRHIAYKGIHEISQMRKFNTSQKYYTILEQDDVSTGTDRRVSAKILVDKSFASSNEAMKVIIPKINESLKNSDYYKSESARLRFSGGPAKVVWLFFYEDISQERNGLPFCRTQWVSKDTLFKPMELNGDESIEQIQVKWQREYEHFAEVIAENRVPKGKYLDQTKSIANRLKDHLARVDNDVHHYRSKRIGFENLRKSLVNLKVVIDSMYRETTDIGFPPYECSEMHRVLVEMVSLFHNIFLIADDPKRDEKNVMYLIDMYLRETKTRLSDYEYEIKKIR